MEQKHEYIDFQPVSPSSLPQEVEYLRCNAGVNTPKSNITLPHRKRGVLIKKVIHWAQSEPVKRRTRIAMRAFWNKGFFAAVVGIVVGGIFTVLYYVGLFIIDMFTQFKTWLHSGGLIIIATGAAGILFLLIVVFVINNAKKSVKFDDWNPKQSSRKKGVEQVHKGGGIVINQIVNINKE